MEKRGDIRPLLFVTGMHLSPTFGRTVEQIEADGFAPAALVPSLVDGDSPEAIAASIGRGTEGFARTLASTRPDLLLVLGDRFEMHAAALAALPFTIPVAHISGGDVTEGAIDDALRHSMTKLSHLHFVANEEAGRRVRQLGEEGWRVHVTGDPAVDHVRTTLVPAPAETRARFGLETNLPALLVTYHPVTLEYGQTRVQVEALLEALDGLDAQILFTYPNADTAGRVIIDAIETFVRTRRRTTLVMNAGRIGYLGLLATVDAMVGNSSSGLIEAPSFELPVVNVGIRQRGRVRGANVIDCPPEVAAIRAAVTRALTPAFRGTLAGMPNPYGDGHAAERIVDLLAAIPLDRRLLLKRFADLPS
jgi:UDP-hydrolysing UDP-N-acetyl-D-glucosamine 2-epimerase